MHERSMHHDRATDGRYTAKHTPTYSPTLLFAVQRLLRRRSRVPCVIKRVAGDGELIAEARARRDLQRFVSGWSVEIGSVLSWTRYRCTLLLLQHDRNIEISLPTNRSGSAFSHPL